MKKLILILCLVLLPSLCTSALASEDQINRRAAMMTVVAISTNAYLYHAEGESTYQSRWARSMVFPVAYSMVEGDAKLFIANTAASFVGIALSEVLMQELWVSVNDRFDGAVVGISINY